MNKQIITLTPEDKFCSGGNRDIYYHDNKTKLIKITKQNVLQHRKDRKKNNFFKKFRSLKDFDENYEDDNFYKNVKHEWLDFIPKSYFGFILESCKYLIYDEYDTGMYSINLSR